MNVPELTLMMLEVIKAGGFTTGGMNFDAKIRRQSIDPDDLLYGHVASMDACARGLLNAAKIIEDGKVASAVDKRYAKWSTAENKAMLEKGATLDGIAARVHKNKIEPQPVSGRQEYIEGLLNNV
jgi:xylose isomerase